MLNSTFPPAVLLEDYGVSYYYYYIHPIICLFASITNLLNTIVLASKELRSSGPFFQYTLVNTAGSMVIMFLLGSLFLTKCGGSVCSISTSYWSQLFVIYVLYYIGYIQYISGAFIQITISVYVYLSIKQRCQWLITVNPYKVCLVFFVLCGLTGIANLIVYEIDSFEVIQIDENGEKQEIIYYYSHLSKNFPYLILAATLLNVITNCSSLLILIIINVLIYKELKKALVKKRTLVGRVPFLIRSTDKNTSHSDKPLSGQEIITTRLNKFSNSDDENNMHQQTAVTIDNKLFIGNKDEDNQERRSLRRSMIMTLWVSFIFASDRLVKIIYRAVVIIRPTLPFTYYLNAFSYFCDILVCSSFLFVYMHTNKMFKKKFYRIFLRRKA